MAKQIELAEDEVESNPVLREMFRKEMEAQRQSDNDMLTKELERLQRENSPGI